MEADIRFEREGREGVVAVGSYLIDAAKRLGVKLNEKCYPMQHIHHCSVFIERGADKLSGITRTEQEHSAANGRRNNERLACEAKIEKAGEIVIMTDEKKEKPKAEDKGEKFRKEFEEMPLNEKVANLVKLEAMMLGETFSFMVDSSMKVFDKASRAMSDFGSKLEREAKEATRPEEHRPKAKAKSTRKSTKKSGGSG